MTDNDQQVPKIPPRWRWAKRLLVAYGLLIVALVASRYVWLHLAEGKYQALASQIEARGEILKWEDLDKPLVSPADNALTVAADAAGLITMTPDQQDMFDDLYSNATFRAAHAADADAICQANAKVFELARKSRLMPKFSHNYRHTRPASGYMLPSLGTYRYLAKVLILHAQRQAEQGDADGAVQTLLDVETLAKRVPEDSYLIGHLVAVATADLTARAVETIAHQLQEPLDRPATMELIESLAGGWLLESQRQAGITERSWQGVVFEDMAAGSIAWWSPYTASTPSLQEKAAIWCVEPLIRTDRVWTIRRLDQIVQAWSQPSWPKTLSLMPREEEFMRLCESELWRWSHPISWMSMPSLGRASELTHRARTDRHMAAIALAMRLYELDHGRMAENLEALSPKYLPAIPLDPFDPADHPIRARLDAAVPYLYSVGKNMADNGGLYDQKNWMDWDRSLDHPFFLRPGGRTYGQAQYDQRQEGRAEAESVYQQYESEPQEQLPESADTQPTDNR